MAREWQQTHLPQYLMPNAVYYQSLWAVRDLERMEKRIRELRKKREEHLVGFVDSKQRGKSGEVYLSAFSDMRGDSCSNGKDPQSEKMHGMNSVQEKENTYDLSLYSKEKYDLVKELVTLERRVEGIRRALAAIPVEYRSCILSNIILQNPGHTFPNKIWRSWKQKFLYNVAQNLALM